MGGPPAAPSARTVNAVSRMEPAARLSNATSRRATSGSATSHACLASISLPHLRLKTGAAAATGAVTQTVTETLRFRRRTTVGRACGSAMYRAWAFGEFPEWPLTWSDGTLIDYAVSHFAEPPISAIHTYMVMMIERRKLYKYLASIIYHISGSITLTAIHMSHLLYVEGLGA
jgi:hypothetical protein